jgi:transcriptional regulator with XRE-family HTH domain
MLRRLTIGRLMRDAREATGRDLKSCARAIGISPQRLLAYEAGQREPTFVELEALAYYLDLPIQALLYEEPAKRINTKANDLPALMQLRTRVVGAKLKQARLQRGESLKAAAHALGITSSRLNSYELGRLPIPITLLERALLHFGLSLDQLLDLGIGPIGEAQLRLAQHARFDGLPEDVRAFVTSPTALPYLQFAMHLSHMPPDDLAGMARVLRGFAEGRDPA